ncbi:MAG: ThuA domain-containing protein, partial [Candidatus Hydrogenedentes bacterium]|nr:ThuA domain-containing protein [Candidatus Hydrogenedentota bacterium]
HSMYFPPAELWEKADLGVFCLWPREKWDYDLIDAYQKRGGGIIFLHVALVGGSNADTATKLPKRIGLSCGPGSKWGVMPATVSLTAAASDSPILRGFPAKFDLPEELYWNLSGNPANITSLLTAPAPIMANTGSSGPPKPEELDGKAWPVIWTQEVGRGKVFATTIGHNFFTFDDPYFRIILLRAMAWTMNESFDPFKPLVTLQVGR